MGYGYEPVEWQDHVTEFPGRREIEQVGENLVMLKKPRVGQSSRERRSAPVILTIWSWVF